MSVELANLIANFETLWPIEGAEEWDAPGLITGAADARISRVLLTVDVTNEIVDEAIDGGFDLILAHHPYLLRGVQTLSESTNKGFVLSKAIRGKVAIYAAHTNADIVVGGVSHVMAEAFGVQKAKPLVPSEDRSVGHGRIGELSTPMQLGEFARLIAKVLPSTATGVRVAGDYEQIIQKVAVCGGAGDSFIAAAAEAGADVYVTSDLRHHPVQDAREQEIASGNSMALIDVAHWSSEWLWLEVAAEQLAKKFSNLQFVVSQLRTDPWDFAITQ